MFWKSKLKFCCVPKIFQKFLIRRKKRKTRGKMRMDKDGGRKERRRRKWLKKGK